MAHPPGSRIDYLTIRISHTGLLADGRPNLRSVLIKDVNFGEEQQTRKHPAYVPVGGSLELPLSDRVFFSYIQGDIRGFLDDGILSVTVPANLLGSAIPAWSFETTSSGVGYVGGFYEFASTDNDFSPSVFFGTINKAVAAHVFVVTGAVPVDEVTITVTGDSIDDNGVRIAGDTDTIVISAGTAINSYFEVKKFNGRVTIETTAGTAITCNYGWSKYWDNNNQDFNVLGLEAIWSSEATDSTSDVELLHHLATGWTFNSGSIPTPPTPIAARSTDHGPDVGQVAGEQGAWKRANLTVHVDGTLSEGILWRITSANSGVGNQSFRILNLHVLSQVCPLGCD